MEVGRNEIDWSFIQSLEGLETTGYVPKDGHSGVTIGAGFDIGNHSVQELYSFNFSIPLLNKLLPYANLTSASATISLNKNPLELSDAEVQELDAKVRVKYAKQVEDEYDAYSDFTFSFLDTAKQTVLMSVAYQYGSLRKECPKFFNAMTKGLWMAAVNELRNFGDVYRPRRLREAKLLESSLPQTLG
jgi:GH24 family phage-related lysozyme (muramidase)